MADIKIYYYYPIVREENVIKVVDIAYILRQLTGVKTEERISKYGEEENLQLKIVKKVNNSTFWELGFLRNSKDSVYKTTLRDSTTEAERLEDDEYIGQECCLIYDEKTKVISLQNNRKSASFKGISEFIRKFDDLNKNIELLPIVYRKEFSEISDNELVSYRNLKISFADISMVNKLAEEDSKESVIKLSAISKDFGGLSGTIELSAGRAKDKSVDKNTLKEIVGFFKKHKNQARGLKVKMQDPDTVKVIDLIENKLNDTIKINFDKENTKNFDKIFDPMNKKLKEIISKELQHCVKITETEKEYA